MKENWEEHPWQCVASITQLFPLSDGFGGNPIFSNIFIDETRNLETKRRGNRFDVIFKQKGKFDQICILYEGNRMSVCI